MYGVEHLNLKEESKKLKNSNNQEIEIKSVRFRTVGDMSCTAAVTSTASNLNVIINEIAASTYSERGARMDDKRSEGAMEERKKVGYF